MQYIYQNNFGTIYADRMSVLIFNQKKTIKTEDIIKIRFVKRKTNCLKYCILFAITILFYIVKPSEQAQILVLITSILNLISLSLMVKKHKIIIIKNKNIIKIDVEKKNVKDAESLINRLKELKRM